MALITSKHIRHLPVFDNNRITGIITIGDVVKEIISEQETTIKNMEQFFIRKLM
jgi:predicted transcriptional regulator